MAGTGALIGTATTNTTGVATQSFAFTLPGNYTIVSAVSQADGTQYGLANASLAQALVLDQTTLTLTQVRCGLRMRARSPATGWHPYQEPHLWGCTRCCAALCARRNLRAMKCQSTACPL